MELTPGTIIDTMLSESMTEEDMAALKAKYDLDKPMVYRYGKYMFRLVQGDLGLSDAGKLSVWNIYITRLPNTLLLSLAALVIGTSVSIPMGIRAAKHAGKMSDTVTTTFTLIGISMPSFWLGLLLMFVFSHWLGWLPAGEKRGFISFILPAVCSGFFVMANSARQTRSSMLEVLNSDFLRTARAKGVPEKVVIRKHALGNAWIPILTTIGTSLSVSLAGSVVIEAVFSWPGIGRATVDAVMARDVTATCGLVIMTTILYIILQLIVDLLYAFVDPRIRAQYAKTGRKRRRTASVETGRAERPAPVSAETVLPALQQTSVEICADRSIPAGSGSTYVEVVGTQDDGDLEKQAEPLPAQTSGAASEPEQHRPAEYSDIAAIKRYKRRSRFGEILHRIRRSKSAMAGSIIIILLLMVFIGSLFIDFKSVTATAAADRFATPSWRLPFGADLMGRNTFLRTVYGTRYSLVIGFASAGIAAIIGVVLGSFAGYYGGSADDIIMRASDVLASIPGLLLGMVIVTVLTQSLQSLIIAVGVTAVPVFIRITRASILSVKSNEFVEAARAIGISNLRIIFTQVLPNGMSPIIVTFTASIGVSIIVGAALSFLGFGVPVPHPEWGALVSAGRNYMRVAPHIITFPGLFIMITVLGFNLLGDGLRDALDPKLKK